MKGLLSSSLDPVSLGVLLAPSSSGSGSGDGMRSSKESLVPLDFLCSGPPSLSGGVLCCAMRLFTGGTDEGAGIGAGAYTGVDVCAGTGSGAGSGAGAGAGAVVEAAVDLGIGRRAGGVVD